jgi:toxin secretion/phage lysis holin
MWVDYLSGVACAVLEGKWTWREGAIGLTQKLALFSMLLFAYWVRRLAGHGWGETLGTFTFAYIVNEGVSIMLNFARIGVPIPEQWVSGLMAVKKLVCFRHATATELADLSKEDKPD